jgi:heavy metal translocating P-type ATPase
MNEDNVGTLDRSKTWQNLTVLAPIVSGFLLLTGWIVSLRMGAGTLSTALYIGALLTGGYFFGREALEELITEQEIGIDLLMAVAAVVAALTGQIGEGAMLAFLYSISEAAEEYTEDKTRASIRSLMSLTPSKALVRRNGTEREIPAEDIEIGDIFIVKPGESIPTDGEVQTGRSSVDQSPVTGESVPVDKAPGDIVFAGTINGTGTMEIEATKTFADNTISRIIAMVEEARERKGTSQRFIERFGAHYSPAVLLVGILVAVVPPTLLGAAWSTWITRATVLVVSAAPCALVISIPITLVASLGTAARQGVLIKGGIYIEELAKVKVIAMDKTGTLTSGEPEVTDVLSLHEKEIGQAQILARAAGVESRSEHPLAQAILQEAESRGISIPHVRNFQSLPGAGASGQVEGRPVLVGNPDLFSISPGDDGELAQTIDRLQREGKTVILIGEQSKTHPSDPTILGLIATRDRIRPNARDAITALHEKGVERVVMLTGDNDRTAQAIARELGIDEVYADLKPEDKVERVRELVRQYAHVGMVGDGVNDAPALAEASVGIAMGAAGTDVALETADVALMGDDLEALAYALELAQRNQTIVKQNLMLSAIVIIGFALGGTAGIFSLPAAVVGHEMSEFVVIANGLRMLRS